MYLNKITEFDILDQDILRPVGKAELRSTHEQELTVFLADRGNLYNRELMIVGRALNGGWWDVKHSLLADPEVCKEEAQKIAKESATRYKGLECPMQWVVRERPKDNSAFWRVIRQVVERLDIVGGEDFDNTWPSHLVWSNLWKVSPAIGGNPRSNKLFDAQFPGCKKLLNHEIRTYEPMRLLFITGGDWAWPFLKDYDIQWFDGEGFVQASGSLDLWFDDKGFVEPSSSLGLAPDLRTRVVVAARPEKKPERKKEIDWVDEVVAELEK